MGRGRKGEERGRQGNHVFQRRVDPRFLLSIFAKNEKADMTPAERMKLRNVLAELVGEYRKGAQRVKGR